MRLHKYLAWVLLLISGSCIEPYQPPAIGSNVGYLVIEGTLTAEDGGGTITLSRTQNLTDGSSQVFETGAAVSLESEFGLVSILTETAPGKYKLSISSFSPSLKYRLRIVTDGGKEYMSDYNPIKQTPVIDSVTMNLEKEGWYLYANTHDPANSTWYYRYEFNEIWEYKSGADSRYNVVTYTGMNGQKQYQVVPSTEDIYHCWKKDSTHNISVATSSNLSSDVIYHFPVKLIPEGDWRIFIKYRVTVKQYAISKEEYNFWQLLKKNTESAGSLFDPLPSNIKGNFTCTSNSSEPVIGFFSIYSKSEVTINKTYQDLYPNKLSPTQYCEVDTLLLEERDPITGELIYSFADDGPRNYLITGEYYDRMSNALLGYFASAKTCADCRSRLYGGTNNKPSDW